MEKIKFPADFENRITMPMDDNKMSLMINRKIEEVIQEVRNGKECAEEYSYLANHTQMEFSGYKTNLDKITVDVKICQVYFTYHNENIDL